MLDVLMVDVVRHTVPDNVHHLHVLKERGHLGDPGVEGSIILRWIFRKWVVGIWTGSRWLR